jgi:putative RNA ligase
MLEELRKRVDLGLIAARPNGRLTIFDYTNQCMFDRAWDEFTMQARGLVLDDHGKIIARPWRKFFNVNERPETRMEALPAETPELSDKVDGSMIIVFRDEETGWRAITRGCWENPQTKYANAWLSHNFKTLHPDNTYMFELIAPWNRLVIPYAKEEMILLGIVKTASGEDASYAQVSDYAKNYGFKAVGFETRPISEIALEDPKVRDREGYVARYSNGLRVKLKYKQYMLLHKILTGLSVKGIWETLSTNNEPSFENVPDEFMDWFRTQRDGLKKAYSDIEDQAKALFQSIPPQPTRKAYADAYKKHPDMCAILFLMLDKMSYAELIWDRIKPHGKTTFQVNQE